MRTQPMRERTVLAGRLILWPLVAASLALYSWAQPNVAGQDPTEASVRGPKGNASNPAPAAPLSGIHRGRAITCQSVRVTNCFELKQPETVVDR